MQEQIQTGTERDQPARTAETCPNCGMAREEWRGNGGQGYSVAGLLYCCQGCAENTGCTCR